MNWQEVCEDPNLRNLPYKIELNAEGKIIMSPQKVYHSIFQGEIQSLLRKLKKMAELSLNAPFIQTVGQKSLMWSGYLMSDLKSSKTKLNAR